MKTISGLLFAALDYVVDYFKQRKEKKNQKNETSCNHDTENKVLRDSKGRFTKKLK